MIRGAVLFSCLCLAIAAAVACGDATDDVAPGDADGGADGGQSGPAGSGLRTGLPCDVQAVIENRCIACHGGERTDAPSLLTYEDLSAPANADPSKSRAELALIRMRSATDPMPPTPAVPPAADEVEVFETWVILGVRENEAACTDQPPPRTGGTAPRTDGAAPPGATGCTSGKTWAGGDTGSPLMHPGVACLACHQQKGGPNLQVGGTVFPAAHEPDDCNGAAPPLTVIVTDSKGRDTAMEVNLAGNFMIEKGQKLFPPFKARVTNGTATRAMMGSVTSGDCNSCHTVAGANGAPGRIMAP